MSDKKEFHRSYRNVIGLFATGVTVLLTEKDGETRGMTANAVTSLSLDPTLLIACPSKASRFAQMLEIGAHFSVNILGDHQEQDSNFFAGTKEGGLAKDDACGLENWSAPHATPRLRDCIGAMACRVHQMHDGGDHWIVVGEVLDLYQYEEEPWPLLFFEGGYHHPSRMAGKHLEPVADPFK
jgi:3-hydroxy-9,10-secoandrosta-1,3,5(10)-triene-9,17-dione monooxygenase reductase component